MLKIGVFGSAAGTAASNEKLAKQVGIEIARRGHVLISGACLGLPFAAAEAAKSAGGHNIGYTAVTDATQHEAVMGTPLSLYDELVTIPKDYRHKDNALVCKKYRNVASVAACDACVFISGRWGTINEFSNAFDMGIVMGILTHSGGFSAHVEMLVNTLGKASKGTICYNADPASLIQLIETACDNR